VWEPQNIETTHRVEHEIKIDAIYRLI
jgi:hypothetical protein